jgi:transcription elongation factor GreA
MSHEIILTPEGHEKLKKELEFLKGPERARIADNIREAKSHGDLRENAMYHEAKLNQTRLEARISELERSLQMAKIVAREELKEGTIHLGTKVTLLDLQFDDEMTVELVGDYEADPVNDLISISSPMGIALKGATLGDEVEVQAPAGVQRYRILAIKDPE